MTSYDAKVAVFNFFISEEFDHELSRTACVPPQSARFDALAGRVAKSGRIFMTEEMSEKTPEGT